MRSHLGLFDNVLSIYNPSFSNGKKWKNRKYHTVRNNIKIHSINRSHKGKIDNPNTHIHVRSLFWFGTCIWIKVGGNELVLASLLS